MEARFGAYVDALAGALRLGQRVEPFQAYCQGLLLDGERKSIEPMAARLDPFQVSARHQSLHHFVAKSAWDAACLLAAVRAQVLPTLLAQGPPLAWIVDDTGIPKKGKHSVGVAHQYCGERGKQDNCQVAVSVSVTSAQASLPVAYRLYLPKAWADDDARRRQAGVPAAVPFQTKPAIALSQLKALVEADLPRAPVLADAAYGNDADFRAQLRAWGLRYALGIQSTVTVLPPGVELLSPPPPTARGRPPNRYHLPEGAALLSVLALAKSLPAAQYQSVTWRAGAQRPLASRFAAVRVQVAHREAWQHRLPEPEWLLIEWPEHEPAPTKYFLSNLPAKTALADLVATTKGRWRIERDYEELKQEVGLNHYEGRNWQGFHHHAALCIAAYGFLVRERLAFSPSAGLFPPPPLPQGVRRRGAA